MIDQDDPKFKKSKERTVEKTGLLNGTYAAQDQMQQGQNPGEGGGTNHQQGDQLKPKKDRGGAFVSDKMVGGFG